MGLGQPRLKSKMVCPAELSSLREIRVRRAHSMRTRPISLAPYPVSNPGLPGPQPGVLTALHHTGISCTVRESAVSFNEFFESIKKAQRRTGTSRGGAWYRGISDGRYKLKPSLLRYDRRHLDAEVNMYAEFWTMIEGVDVDDSWQRLSYMQHYGVPTRLLDWSTDLNTALYFALGHTENNRTGDPYIWVLNPYKLNHLYAGEYVIYDNVDKVDFDYYDSALKWRKERSFPNKTPLAMKPMWSNARIRLQSGCFTFHGEEEPLESLVETRVAIRVQIPHDAVYLMRKKIMDEGVNALKMFGGVEGLATFVRRSHL